jgi:hypothetical protein
MNFLQLWSCRLDCRGPNGTVDTHMAYIIFDIYTIWYRYSMTWLTFMSYMTYHKCHMTKIPKLCKSIFWKLNMFKRLQIVLNKCVIISVRSWAVPITGKYVIDGRGRGMGFVWDFILALWGPNGSPGYFAWNCIWSVYFLKCTGNYPYKQKFLLSDRKTRQQFHLKCKN